MKKSRMTVGLKRVMSMLAVIVAVALWAPAVCSPLPVMAADTSAQDGEIALAVSLFKGVAEESMSFEAANMFPGDAVTKNYTVKVSYRDTATLNFHADIEEGYEKLAEVLKCEVVLVETAEKTVLHDGLMKDMPNAVAIALQNAGKTTEELQYSITVYLDKSVTSEYQNQALRADFIWWIEEIEQRIETTSLTVVPEGLKNTEFNTVEKIKGELGRILISEGGSEYSIGNMEFYDVRLQFWNGREWIDATEDSFPLEGINVTLPYPEGTGRNTHDFIVSHMFTVDSDRLGIRAGEVEYPPVTKTENGLNVTFKGLSPVAVAWKALETEENIPDVSPEEEPADSNISTSDTMTGNVTTDTGDNTPIVGYICLMLITVGSLICIIGMKIRKEAVYEK